MLSVRKSGVESTRLDAIGAAAAEVFRKLDYRAARTQDVAAAVHLTGESDGRSHSGGRSAVWLHNEVRSKRVLVALAAHHAWREHLATGTSRIEPAPLPPSANLADAIARMASALIEIVRFHRAERFLMTQVGQGIGDIATSEKRQGAGPSDQPTWPDDETGAVASDAFAARLSVFTDFLIPHMRAAAEVATAVSEAELRASARALSDLVFRACLADLDGPVGRIGDGLAAYWFERDLVRWAGPWIRDLDGAERSVQAIRRRKTDPRAEAYALGALVRFLLEAGTLYHRTDEESTRLVAALEQGAEGPADLRACCDATYRHGLALLRYGRLIEARERMEASRRLAIEDLDGDAERVIRADHGLAETLIELGEVDAAQADLRRVCELRRAIHEEASSSGGAAWRRLTLSEEALALATIRSGAVVEGVLIAEKVLASRQAQYQDLPQGGLAQAHLLCATAWLEAGHPSAAREAVSAAFGDPHVRLAVSGHRSQSVLVLQAAIALGMGRPEHALRLLRDAPVSSSWFRNRVSPRLAARASLVTAAALTDTGSAELSLDLIRGELTAELLGHVRGSADPVFFRLVREEVRALISLRRLEEARDKLSSVSADAYPAPERAELLRLSALCIHDPSAATLLTDVLEAVELDSTHPVLLAVRMDAAEILEAAGSLSAASDVLSPVLSTALLPHGRTCLGAEHPLLRRAAVLADRIGLIHPWTTFPDPLES